MQSPSEFLKPLKNESFPTRTLAAIYYICEIEKRQECTVSDIRESFKRARDKASAEHNVTSSVSRCADKGFLHGSGLKRGRESLWQITDSGKVEITALLGLSNSPKLPFELEVAELTLIANTLTNVDVREYLLEAIKCLGATALRASVVFVWSGAMRLIQQKLYDKHRGSALNSALAKHGKAKDVHTMADWAYIRDELTLQAAQDLNIFNKPEHTVLGHHLDVRNHCGHPSTYSLTPTKTKAIIEEIVSLVFKRMS